MTLKDTLQADLKTAMKAGDNVTRDTVRSVLGAVASAEKAGKEAREFSDPEIVQVIQKQLKQRVEMVEVYAGAGRADRAAQEKAEAEVLERYLPKQLTDDEAREILVKTLETIPADAGNRFGELMKLARPQVAGKFDGKRFAELAKELVG